MSFGKLIRNPNLIIRVSKVLEEPMLSPGSREFLTSLKEFIERSGGLTDKQIAGFEKIESAFAPDKKEKMHEWVNSYTPEMRADWNILMDYYATTTYFKDVIAKSKSDPSFVPSSKQWQSVTSNKYALAVLEATKSEPKYKKGTQVFISKKAPISPLTGITPNMRGCAAFVVQVNSSPVTSACKGAKKYKVLPFKSTRVVEIEERFIKRTSKTKESNVNESEHTISD